MSPAGTTPHRATLMLDRVTTPQQDERAKSSELRDPVLVCQSAGNGWMRLRYAPVTGR